MKRKRILAVVLMTFIAMWYLCSCQSSDLKKKASGDSGLPELKIGVDLLKPFFYTDENGDYAGIDAEIAAEACKRAGYKPKFVEINWSTKDEYLQNKTVDCLWTAFTKNGREDQYRWTDSYMQSGLRAIVGAQNPDQDIESTIEHGSIAVRAGSKAEEIFLKNDGGKAPVQVYSCGTFEMAETAFVKGYAGALCCHEEVLEEVMKNYPGLYRFLDGTIMETDLGVAFLKDDTSEKYEQINQALSDMKEDGTITHIIEKYVPESSDDGEVPADVQK